MTIYHRLKVWIIKGYRAVRYGFLFVQPRTVNMIWLLPVYKTCDYCGNDGNCVTLECDYEVVATICGECLAKAQRVLGPTPTSAPTKDHRGVIM